MTTSPVTSIAARPRRSRESAAGRAGEVHGEPGGQAGAGDVPHPGGGVAAAAAD
ncbi:hypothetical protein [Dactylosporangium sp. NPDC048998]|uniref:hypothetical protein n=1 Tax=Dactylosporangium sp. NPDC048998 TaxID=3363976 RepID=UPI00371926F6